MNSKRLVFLALLSLLLSLNSSSLVEAKRSGSSSRGSRSRSSSWGSRSSYSYSRSSSYNYGSYNYGSTAVVIGTTGYGYGYQSYSNGYNPNCPNRCMVNGVCGTEVQCKASSLVTWIFVAIFLIIFFSILACFCVFFAKASKLHGVESASTLGVLKDQSSSVTSWSRKKPDEPLLEPRMSMGRLPPMHTRLSVKNLHY